jgi:tRNA(Arg) A34 adenosine deaminase TadA
MYLVEYVKQKGAPQIARKAYALEIDLAPDGHKRIASISEKHPLGEGHLKRARREKSSLMVLVGVGDRPEGMEGLVEVEVPGRAPASREEYEEFSRVWPCVYRPHPLPPEIMSREGASRVMRVLEATLSGHSPEDCSSAIAVVDSPSEYTLFVNESPESVLDHAVMKGVRAISRATSGYLCTGKAVVSVSEPCTVCAMAMVHGRVKALYFQEDRPEGAIRTARINDKKELNHRYPAYKMSRIATSI